MKKSGAGPLWCSGSVSRRVIAAVSISLLVACGSASRNRETAIATHEGRVDSNVEVNRREARRSKAVAMWEARCKRAGVTVFKHFENVGGIYLVNVRLRNNFDDQYALDDPYGKDSVGERYIANFLKGFYREGAPLRSKVANAPPRVGYGFVEATDPKDGKLYRFTGRFEEPWLTDKNYLKGYTRFVLDRLPIEKRTARFGVKFEDVSTREERDYWIAASSLKVIDLDHGEVVGERIGYMIDLAQGDRGGYRSPWLFAADHACPDFRINPKDTLTSGSVSQDGQSLDFVEKVLKPVGSIENCAGIAGANDALTALFGRRLM